MKNQSFSHSDSQKTGVLLVNLGTPDSPDVSSVRRYLKEFLWDPRVVEFPRVLWWFVLHLIILVFRSKRAAKAYQKVWTSEGSPLMSISKKQCESLKPALQEKYGDDIEVELAMRYGNPSIRSVLEKMDAKNVKRLLVLPLYPQYSATTTASIFDEVAHVLKSFRWIPEVRFINHYHDDKNYISALAQSIKDYWNNHQQPDILMMSFHGIPQDYFIAGDPYYCECQKTGRLLAQALELSENEWCLTFQSRLGRKPWLQPYTDKTLIELVKGNKKSVHVICPGFSADCLETLEEVDMENREVFMQAGGEQYHYIPCLNESPLHINMMTQLVEQHSAGWDKILNDEQTMSRAKKLGAEQ